MVLGCRRHSPGGLLQQENCVASKLQKTCLIEKCRCQKENSISKEKQMHGYNILSPLSENGYASEAFYELWDSSELLYFTKKLQTSTGSIHNLTPLFLRHR